MPMPPPTSLHDIKLLVQSYHPLIVIETVEEERARALAFVREFKGYSFLTDAIIKRRKSWVPF